MLDAVTINKDLTKIKELANLGLKHIPKNMRNMLGFLLKLLQQAIDKDVEERIFEEEVADFKNNLPHRVYQDKKLLADVQSATDTLTQLRGQYLNIQREFDKEIFTNMVSDTINYLILL